MPLPNGTQVPIATNFEESAMTNATIKVTTVERSPYSIFVRDEGGNVQGYRGYIFDLLDRFTATYNLSYEVVVPLDNEFGIDLGNGTWTGMMGMLLKKEADMAAAFVTVTEERSAVIDFSVAISYEAMNILQQHPAKAANPAALVAPFTLETWIAMLTATGVAAVGIQMFRFSEKLLYSDSPVAEPPLDEGVGQTVDFVLRTILNQGGELPVNSNSCRLICYSWLLFAAIVSCMYTANLTAFMAVLVYDIDIKSMDDIPRHSDVKWMVRQGSAISASILKVPDDTSDSNEERSFFMTALKKSYDRKKGMLIKGDKEAVSLVKKKGYIYVRERTVLQSLIAADVGRHHHCRFMMGQDGHMISPEAFGFQRGSEYRLLFDTFAKSMEKYGHLIGIRKHHVDKPLCTLTLRDDTNEERPMTFGDFIALYVILSVGFTLGLLAFVMENVVYRRAALWRWCQKLRRAFAVTGLRTPRRPKEPLRQQRHRTDKRSKRTTERQQFSNIP